MDKRIGEIWSDWSSDGVHQKLSVYEIYVRDELIFVSEDTG